MQDSFLADDVPYKQDKLPDQVHCSQHKESLLHPEFSLPIADLLSDETVLARAVVVIENDGAKASVLLRVDEEQHRVPLEQLQEKHGVHH